MAITINNNCIIIGTRAITPTEDGFSFNGCILSDGNLIQRTNHARGTLNGYIGGGYSSPPGTCLCCVDRFPFTSDSPAVKVGALPELRSTTGGSVASGENGYFIANCTPTGISCIYRFAFSNDTSVSCVNCIDTARNDFAGQSSDICGYQSGGKTPGGLCSRITNFLYANEGCKTTTGSLTEARCAGTGHSSNEFGFTANGENATGDPAYSNVIDKFPFASNANATDVGDVACRVRAGAGTSSEFCGYTMGGRLSGPLSEISTITKFSFVNNGNSTVVGNLSQNTRALPAGISSLTDGYRLGGISNQNNIDKFSFASETNATCIGNFCCGRSNVGGTQD